MDAIRSRFGANGIREPTEAYGRVGAITDDTQMTLFTSEALLQWHARYIRGVGAAARYHFWPAYQRWLDTQGERPLAERDVASYWFGELHEMPELRARRAPGNTCLGALASTEIDATADNDSKGCGGVMRAAPCGLVGAAADPFLAGVCAARITHGHPSGYLAAGALATIIHRLVAGDALDHAIAAALVELQAREDAEEVVRAIEAARDAADRGAGSPHVLASLGAGWVADEALAIALYAVLSARDDFAATIRLAANHGGDSDSTAAIAGNISGAMLGVQAIPRDWLDVLELRMQIDRLAHAMYWRFIGARLRVGWDYDSSVTSRAPCHDAFWVLPDQLLAGPYPGAKDEAEAETKLTDFLDAGVRVFIDLTEEGELRRYAPTLRRLAAKDGLPVTHLRIPIGDVDVPEAWEMEVIIAALSHSLDRLMDSRCLVYVHCWGGVGRTGTVVACYLIDAFSLSPNQALAQLAQMRSGTQRSTRSSPETEQQTAFVRNWSKRRREPPGRPGVTEMARL